MDPSSSTRRAAVDGHTLRPIVFGHVQPVLSLWMRCSKFARMRNCSNVLSPPNLSLD